MSRQLFLFLLATFFLTSCKPSTPKDAVVEIVRTNSEAILYSKTHFQFEYAGDAKFELVDSTKVSYWFNLTYPQFKGRLYCSYQSIDSSTLSGTIEDSHRFAYSHLGMAEQIEEDSFSDTNRHLSGLIYQIRGDVASPLQFYVTDSEEHFLRGSFYYDTQIRSDSVALITPEIEKDIQHLLRTLKWNN